MENLQVKNYALVTGASAGTGKEIAIECAKRGFNLFLVSLPETGLENFSKELKYNYQIDVQYYSIDLRKRKSPKKVFEYAQKNNLPINILVNCAGIGFEGKLENLTADLIDTMVLLNVRAATLLTFYFIPELKKQKEAYILNIGSFAALAPLPFKCVYAATKTYLLFFTQALNSELKGSNISVSSVHPLGIKTDRVLEKVKKMGFWSRAAALTPARVAQISIENMLNKTPFVVPGIINKFYYSLGICLPHGLILRIIGNIFQKTT